MTEREPKKKGLMKMGRRGRDNEEKRRKTEREIGKREGSPYLAEPGGAALAEVEALSRSADA